MNHTLYIITVKMENQLIQNRSPTDKSIKKGELWIIFCWNDSKLFWVVAIHFFSLPGSLAVIEHTYRNVQNKMQMYKNKKLS